MGLNQIVPSKSIPYRNFVEQLVGYAKISIILGGYSTNMRGIIKWWVATVCVIGFLSNGERMNVGGEKKIHGRISEVSHWEAEDTKKKNLAFNYHSLYK